MEVEIIAFVMSSAGSVYFCGIGLFLILEAMAPMRAVKGTQWTRWLSNIGLVLINTVLLRWATAVLGFGASVFAQLQGWGLLNAFPLPSTIKIIASVLIADLVLYFCHRLYHASDLAWRFHVVHHSDSAIDLTTAFRFHPFEAFANGMLCAGAAVLLGLSPAGLLIHRLFMSADGLFGHSNVRIPEWLDRILGLVIVTPRFHHIHHARTGAEYHSNFGIGFTFWDRLFRTHCRRNTAWLDTMPIGVEGCERGRRFQLPWLLAQPFVSIGETHDPAKPPQRVIDAD